MNCMRKMSVCFYLDVAVYFLVGVLLILVLRRPPKDENENAYKAVYMQAFFLGIIFAGLRYGMQYMLGKNAAKKITAMFESDAAPPQKIADIIST